MTLLRHMHENTYAFVDCTVSYFIFKQVNYSNQFIATLTPHLYKMHHNDFVSQQSMLIINDYEDIAV